MRIRKSGAEFPLRHRFAYIFTLFFSIKSTFSIMGIYHSHRLQKRIYYHASHELHSTLFQVCRDPIGPFVGSFIALIQYFSVSKGTISRYMNEAIERGYAKRDKKGIHLLREDIFLITSESQLAIIKNLYPEIFLH